MPSKGKGYDKKNRDGGRFIAIPEAVLASPVYVALSVHAKVLLTEIAFQYKGYNNGDLDMTWDRMSKRGFKSKETLQKAKVELLKSHLICETKKGGRPNKASLYAMTWHALDECGGKLDMSPSVFPRGAYRNSVALLPLKKATGN